MRSRLALLLVASVAVLAATASTALAHPHFRAYYTYVPSHLTPAQQVNQAMTHSSIPIFAGEVKSRLDNNTYQYTMVGHSPFYSRPNDSATIGTDVVPINVVIGGVTYSAAHADSRCGQAGTAESDTLNSPLFQNHQYTVGGVDVGNTQYVDAFQREEFAKYALGASAVNPGYHVLLSGTRRAVVSVSVPAADSATLATSGGCMLAGIDQAWWQNYVEGTLIPRLENAGITDTVRDVIFLMSNVVWYSNGDTSQCCILGWHGSTSGVAGGTQYYETADYDSTPFFGSNATGEDVSPLSHEIGEWFNDPSGGNLTPYWGHVGQVGGCQNNLEVGDPLSGTTVSIPGSNGLTYHPQELAFFSWFFRDSSIGLNGWYSSNGTFKHGAGPVCS